MPKAPPTYRPNKRTRRTDVRTRDEKGHGFYDQKRWKDLRKMFLSRNPLCANCAQNGIVKPATEVHHKKRRREHPDLAYVWSNLEQLCKPCHSRATRAESTTNGK